jgi:citrate synthase
MSWVFGWTAHVAEQDANHRPFRRCTEYTGPQYPQRHVTIENR